MKLAPWITGAAVGLLLATMGWADRAPYGAYQTPLDLTGIDTLVVRGNSVNIHIDATQPASVSNHRPGLDLQPRREGGRLILDIPAPTRGDYLQFVVPPSVRRFELGDGSIEARGDGVDALDVRVDGSLRWSGAARSLRIEDRRRIADCDYTCGSSIAIGAGRIEQLVVRTDRGTVALEHVDQIGHAVLALGGHATFSLGALRRLPTQVEVVPLDAPALPAIATPERELPDVR